jgi:transposase-like protein
MPSGYRVEVRRQVVELACLGTRVAQVAEAFGMSETCVYGWSRQDRSTGVER